MPTAPPPLPPLPLGPVLSAVAGPLAVAAGLAAFRWLDFGTPGIVVAFLVCWALLAWLWFLLRHAAAAQVAGAVAHRGTLVRLLLEHRAVNAAFALGAGAVLSAHLLVFTALVQPVFLVVVALDALLVGAFAALMTGRFADQLVDGAARLVRELAVIALNVLLLFALFVAVDTPGDGPVPLGRFDAAVAAANARRAATGGSRVDTAAERPLTVFDDRLPLLAVHEVMHSSLPFRAVARTARTIDLNVKSLRLAGGWGAAAYWTIYVVSLSFLPFLAITLLFRAVVRLPVRVVASPERSHV
jgi:hypothetical protein